MNPVVDSNPVSHSSDTGKPLSALPAWRVIKLAFDPPAKHASAEEKLAFEVRNAAVFNGPNFLPSEAELEFHRRVLVALEEAAARGSAATVVDGAMVDTAMAATARQALAWAAGAP